MATTALAKGPLSSALGQWLFIGFGTVVIFTGDNGVSKAAQEVAQIALKLVTGRSSNLLTDTAHSQQSLQQMPPVVIHNISPSSDNSNSPFQRNGYTATLIQLSMGAGACWAVYIFSSQLLPESIKEMLPVTRKFFDTAITSLGQGIIRVRDALSEQISQLGLKQDALSEKQDQTHSEVLGLKDDIGGVRGDIDDIALAISRCEDSLADAAGRQTYMTKGVRLLVRCVGDLMRGSDPGMARELDQFTRLGGEMDGGLDAPMTPVNGRSNQSHHSSNYPASPILSEISGSGTASEDIRPFSLPPQSQSSQKTAMGCMNSAPSMISPPSFGRSPSLPLTHQHSGFMSMRSMSRQASSPEDEVPSSERSPNNSGVSTPHSSSPGGVDPLQDVHNLLRMTNNGGASVQAHC